MSDMSATKSRALGWRQPILRHFTPEIATATRLTIVADPDGLLTEQEILDALRERGFDLVPFEDHVAFRFAYESRYRQMWDRGDKTNLVVALRMSRGDLDALPYDLLEQARRQERCLTFTIGDIFPNLVPNVIGELDRSDLDALFEAQAHQDPGKLGVNASKDFVLRHVFEVAPELIKKPADLLRVLLRKHYQGQRFPPALDDRFIHLLSQSGRWKDWPLDQIVPNRSVFLEFLDERWPIFLRSKTKPLPDHVADSAAGYALRIPGPVDLPFDHDDVHSYIDKLFQEGRLSPTDVVDRSCVGEPWMLVGVAASDRADESDRFCRLLERLVAGVPEANADQKAWIDYTKIWAEYSALRWSIGNGAAEERTAQAEELHDRIESAFAAWMLVHFASLYNLSYVHRPVMVHHIVHHLSHHFAPTGAGPVTKHALVVVDGMAFDQWVHLRRSLSERLGKTVRVDEDGVFAWVPTLTSVSRQAIFAGDAPFTFEQSLRTTEKEEAHWQRFWEEKGCRRQEVQYTRQKKDEDFDALVDRVMELADHPKTRMLGVVINTIDRSMHGMVTGTSGMHSIVRDWAQGGAFASLVAKLLGSDYEVVITADHGNIAGRGIGKPDVGAIADERGERAHVFPDETTRAEVHRKFESSIEWPDTGLPAPFKALLASGRSAFTALNTTIVGHGGIAMEEVIVPFVRLTRKPA